MTHSIKTIASEPPRGKMTYEEFLAWTDEDTNAEWVDGEVVPVSPASDAHNDLGGFLLSLLRFFADARQLGVVRHERFQMRLAGRRRSGREPDVLFVANEHLSQIRRTYLEGPADLAIEIISAESDRRDRVAKFEEYEAGGVREFWLLDPENRQAEFYLLDTDGSYQPVLLDAEGVYHSAVLSGLWLQVDWLWQRPHPPLLEVLRAWGLL
jgi:Uma2 family endonuclease